MDTNDLKDLFNQQSGDSRLTASGIARRVERQRTLRRAGVASGVSLAIAGVAVGGLWLNASTTRTLPAIPEPTPVVTTDGPTEPIETGPVDVEGPRELVACTVQAPESWTALLAAPLPPEHATEPWIEKDGTQLTWHQGVTAITIADDADEHMGAGVTDGRHVLYQANGQMKVWDSRNADADPAWALPGTFGSDLPAQAFLDDGTVWFTQVDDVNLPREEQLATGTDATELASGTHVTVGAPWDGGLQVRMGDGDFQLLHLDGSLTELPSVLGQHPVAMTSGDLALLHSQDSPQGPSYLYGDRWDESRLTDAWKLDGDWVMSVATGQYEGRQTLTNVDDGVQVVLPEGDFDLGSGYLFDAGSWTAEDGQIPAQPLVMLADLPPVGCDDAEPADEASDAAGPTADTRTLADGVVCTVDAPASWQDVLDDPAAHRPDTPWIEHRDTTLIWHQDGTSTQIADDADYLYGGGQTDGRYVVYLTGDGAKVWDSLQPDDPAWALEGSFPADGGAGVHVADGRIWLMQHDDMDLPPAEQATTISVIDLESSSQPTVLLEDQAVTVSTAFDGGLQVAIGDGPFELLMPDGSRRELPSLMQDHAIVASSGDLVLVTPRAIDTFAESEYWLYGPDEPARQVDGHQLAGEWLLGSGEGADDANSYWVQNAYTGVRVSLPDHELGYGFSQGHLWVPNGPTNSDREPVDLHEMPEVGCR